MKLGTLSDRFTPVQGMLEDINNVLNAGEVPNLMRTEDSEEIGTALRPLLLAEGGTTPTKASLNAFFTSRVRANLHLVLAMSPVGEAFRRRLRMFPALVNCCTLDWFREWPVDALTSVAHHFYGVCSLPPLFVLMCSVNLSALGAVACCLWPALAAGRETLRMAATFSARFVDCRFSKHERLRIRSRRVYIT